ncbi:glycosyltransferase family 2 protein [Mycobacterium paraense]|uniref:glycosyltransferase family 2 protein n=1 Tax=Mycobacterium paraense TaxID=767916 RepID=UPI000A1554BB|nr:glycosyltransferase family A protein [Mycobacterium paraense]MCV7443750.1 glycosyltransferase family 2 protein [Mycobacterium paraense]
MPSVSVLTATYHHGAFIGTCIKSVLRQTNPDWEMIIVDDGSEDGTPDIAESFGDPRIIVIRRPHEGIGGLGRGYASALARATSPIVAILDGDDTWPDHKIEQQLPLFADPGVVLSYGPAGLMDENGVTYAKYWHKPRGAVARNDPVGSILPALVRLNFINASTVMIRRTALDEVGGFWQPANTNYVDLPTWLRLAMAGRFAPAPEVVGYWRRHSTQVTTRGWLDNTNDRTAFLKAFVSDVRDRLPPSVTASLEEAACLDASRQNQEAWIARGRIELIEGNWGAATGAFSTAFRSGGASMRSVAAVGILCALARTDMEAFVRARGRHALPSRRHLATHGLAGRAGTFAGGNA